MSEHLNELEAERQRLIEELAQIGDFRPGSIATNYRRCGKTRCACVESEHPGHGPQFLLTTRVKGRSHAVNLHPGGQLRRAEREVANYRHFRELVQRIVEVSAKICEEKHPAAP